MKIFDTAQWWKWSSTQVTRGGSERHARESDEAARESNASAVEVEATHEVDTDEATSPHGHHTTHQPCVALDKQDAAAAEPRLEAAMRSANDFISELGEGEGRRGS